MRNVPICIEMESEILVVTKPKGQKLDKKIKYNIKNLSRRVKTKTDFSFSHTVTETVFLGSFLVTEIKKHWVKSTRTPNTRQRERVFMYILACMPTLG